jgi:ubiquitin
MAQHNDFIADWVETFKSDYLQGASDRFDAESSIDDLLERAMESLESELKSACEDAVEEYYDEDCANCNGDGACPFCGGDGECPIYHGPDNDHEDCPDCGGDNRCQECVTTAGVCEACNGSGKERDEYGS